MDQGFFQGFFHKGFCRLQVLRANSVTKACRDGLSFGKGSVPRIFRVEELGVCGGNFRFRVCGRLPQDF